MVDCTKMAVCFGWRRRPRNGSLQRALIARLEREPTPMPLVGLCQENLGLMIAQLVLSEMP